MINQAVKAYQEYYERILPTGSRVICSTPPNDTDEDYIILVIQDKLQSLVQRLQSDGWITDMSYSNNDGVLELNSEHEFYENGEVKTEKLFQSWKRHEKPNMPIIYDWALDKPQGTGTLFNILVTCNQQYFEDFTRATFLAKALDLKDKSDRVVLFQALCQDIWPIERKKKPVLGINHPGWNPAEPQSVIASNMTANGWTQIAPGTWTIPINFATPIDPPVNPNVIPGGIVTEAGPTVEPTTMDF